MVGTAALLGESVPAGLEDVQLGWNIGLTPRAVEINGALPPDSLIVGRYSDEQRRRTILRGLRGISPCGIDRRCEVGPGVGRTGDSGQ